jgi:hypothetical protein
MGVSATLGADGSKEPIEPSADSCGAIRTRLPNEPEHMGPVVMRPVEIFEMSKDPMRSRGDPVGGNARASSIARSVERPRADRDCLENEDDDTPACEGQ